MRHFVFFLILGISCAGIARNSAAQGGDVGIIKGIYTSQERACSKVMEQIIKEKDQTKLESDIYQYRNCYAYRPDYSPFSDDLVDQMMKLAFLSDTSEDPEKAQQNLVAYKDFVYYHIVDIGVLKKAYMMSKDDPRYGNPVFLGKVLDIMKRILYKPGYYPLTPETAYNILTYSEENYLLAKLGGEIKRSETYDVYGKVYNVYDIKDPKTGKTKTYYFEITVPITALKNRKMIEDAESNTSLPKQ